MPDDRARADPRYAARVIIDGEEREIVEAWRTSRGSTLVLAFPGPRRILVSASQEVAGMDADALGTALDGSAGLTATEACFEAPDGRRWLAQSVGPAWSGSDGGEGVSATLFTSIDGPFERFLSKGSPLRPDRSSDHPVEPELAEIWRTGHERDGG